MDHGKDGGKERTLPEYSWDYCFPGDELGFKRTVLVGRERVSKSWECWAIDVRRGDRVYGGLRVLHRSRVFPESAAAIGIDI